MHRKTLLLIVGAATFMTGVTLGSWWSYGNLLRDRREEPVSIQLTQRELNFKLTLKDSGPNSTYSNYESNDGVKLSQGCIKFSSVERANAEFEYKINSYPYMTKILKKEPKTDSNGRSIGMRIVALEFGKESGQLASVRWTNNEEMCWIESPSLRHVLELEKQEHF